MSDDEPTTEAPTWEPDLVAVARIEEELVDVERALERLDEGTYGTCEACGAPLPDEQLSDAPAARYCAEHAQS